VKRTMGGRTHDTRTAKLVLWCSSPCSKEDSGYLEESLYRSPGGCLVPARFGRGRKRVDKTDFPLCGEEVAGG